MARTKRKTNPVIPAMEAPAQAQKQYRAAAYVRLSVEDSGKPGADTIEGQKHLLLRFIEDDPTLTLYGLFCDNGRTGTDFDRPQFEKMMEEVRKGHIDCIVVKDLSRFGRNYKETGNYLERIFPFLGVRFIAVNDGFDTLTAQRGADGYLVPLKNLINEVYSKDISRKSGSALAAKQKNGDFIGAWAPYGYRKQPDNPHKLEPDEATAPVVRQIFRWRAGGMGITQIARRLNDSGVPSPSAYLYNTGVCKTEKYNGVSWYVQTVKNLLSRQVYIGHMVQGRKRQSFYENRGQYKKPQEEWIVVENTHEPLIDKETFQKVRMLVNSRRHTRSRTYDFLLKGLIFCHECGYPMAVLNRPPVSGEDRLFFVCRTYQRFTKAGVCSCHSIKEQVVTEAVLAKVREVCEAYLDPNKLQPIAADAVEKARKAENHEAEIQSIQNKIDSLTANLDKMYMDRLTGLLAEADFERIYLRVKMDRTSLEEKLKELESQKESPVSTEDRARELVQQFLDSAYTSRELLVSLIERVELTENKQIIIKFRFRELEAIS